MLGNEELQERLAVALESQLHSIQFDRFNEPEWIVMLALFSIHHLARDNYHVNSLAEETNRILRENGETRFYSPKKVGQILNKSLGFPTRRRGEGYRIDLALVGRKIHSQAKAMGIKRSDILHWASAGPTGEACSLCSEYGMMENHEGRRLLTLDEYLEASAPPCKNCGLQSLHLICPQCRTPR